MMKYILNWIEWYLLQLLQLQLVKNLFMFKIKLINTKEMELEIFKKDILMSSNGLASLFMALITISIKMIFLHSRKLHNF